MATAPKDVELLLYFPADEKHSLSPMLYVSKYPPGFPRRPTHWHALPAPPEVQ